MYRVNSFQHRGQSRTSARIVPHFRQCAARAYWTRRRPPVSPEDAAHRRDPAEPAPSPRRRWAVEARHETERVEAVYDYGFERVYVVPDK